MKLRTPSPRNAGQAKVILPLAVIVILIGVGIGVYVAYKHFQHQALKEAARAPKDSTAVLAMDNPRETLEETLNSAKEFADDNEDFKKIWDKWIEEAKEKLGFDPSNVDAYAEAGFDLNKPITVAILALDEKRLDPTGVVIGIGTTDPKAAMATVEKLAEKEKLELEEDKGEPTLHLVKSKGSKKPEMVLATTDGRLFIAFGSRRDKEDDLVDRTRDFFKARSGGDNLAGTEVFKTTVGRLSSGGGVFSGFVHLADIFDKLPKREKVDLMDDFRAVAFASGKNSGSAFIHLAPSSKLEEHLQPGAECRSFLAKMDKPLAAFTVSLKDVGELVKYFADKTMKEKERGRMLEGFEKEFGMEFGELSKLLKGGAGGACIYGPDEDSKRSEPQALVFFKVNDKEKGKTIAKETVWKMLSRRAQPEEKEVSDGFLYTTKRYSSALIGDYVVVGNANEQIEKLANGEGGGWSPACGGSDVMAYEVFISDAVDAFSKEMPKEFKKAMQKIMGEDSYAFSRIAEVDDEGILAVYENRGGSGAGVSLAAIAAAIAIPNLIEARKHGNEAAAIGALRTLQNSQAIFREGDKEGDDEMDYGSLKELADQDLIDGVLGSGTKQGYIFECKPGKETPEYIWFATARPAVPGTTGDRYFATNHEGVTFYRTSRPFKMNDDTCEIPKDAFPVGK